jgi:hypothetical protein
MNLKSICSIDIYRAITINYIDIILYISSIRITGKLNLRRFHTIVYRKDLTKKHILSLHSLRQIKDDI